MNLDTTIKAIQDGITELAVDKGIKEIDGWMKKLEEADFRGAKTIHDNLGKLKKHLAADELDGPAIGKLLHTLGQESKQAASQASGAEGTKLEHLAELLSKSGGDLSK